MPYARQVGDGIPRKFLRQFEALGEPVVIHRLARFDDRAQREAALEWLRQCRAARREAQVERERQKGRRENRRVAIAAIGTVAVILTIFAVVSSYRPPPQSPLAALSAPSVLGAAEFQEPHNNGGVLP